MVPTPGPGPVCPIVHYDYSGWIGPGPGFGTATPTVILISSLASLHRAAAVVC